MKRYRTLATVLGVLALMSVAAYAVAQSKSNPGKEGHSGAQAVADVIRAQAGADGAILTANYVKQSYSPKDLSSLMMYPTEGIVVVKLKGSQLRAAFEKAIGLYPQANQSFLQISGFSIDIDPAKDKKITAISTDSGPLDDNRTYEIAMPALLGRGGMGYNTIWNKSMIVRTLEGVTLESVLKDKAESPSSSRWRVR
jgi:2',3'-cyclic-nucleotide 2'-phosphodiesterase (5'-nucleotidase family)